MVLRKKAENEEKKEEKTHNSKEAIETAKSIIKHAGIGEKHNIKIGDIASFLSLIAIAATIALFQRNTGYCRVYNIPTEAIPLNLENYIPACVNVLCFGYYLLLYFAEMKIDSIYQTKKINPMRIFWGTIILLGILTSNNLGKYLGPIFCLILSISIPTVIEIVLWLRRKGTKVREYTETTYRMRVYEHIHNYIMYKYGIKSGLIFIIVSVTLFPLLGELSAKAKTSYQICTYQNKTYAIIVEQNDEYLIQEATISDNNLKIYTGTYCYIGKKDIVLTRQTFDSVAFQKEGEELPNTNDSVKYEDKTKWRISIMIPENYMIRFSDIII